jgi:RNA polymerase sigma-70 factor (ECF subfamily)
MTTDRTTELAERFEENRSRLRAVAYRMLGSESEAEDAVQESWLRLSRSADDVDNLPGWLTTVVSRICLDMLRSRKSRREEPIDTQPADASAPDAEPEREVMLGESIGLALLVVLETLTPAERVAFVLHDLFGISFDEIAPILGRNPAAARQLASRARRRVRGAAAPTTPASRKREIVEAFLAASRAGDYDALITLLDPNVVARSDRAAAEMGAEAEVRGAAAVTETFAGRAKAARVAVVGGEAGLVWASQGRPQVAFVFTIVNEKVAGIDLIADPGRLSELEIEL